MEGKKGGMGSDRGEKFGVLARRWGRRELEEEREGWSLASGFTGGWEGGLVEEERKGREQKEERKRRG